MNLVYVLLQNCFLQKRKTNRCTDSIFAHNSILNVEAQDLFWLIWLFSQTSAGTLQSPDGFNLLRDAVSSPQDDNATGPDSVAAPQNDNEADRAGIASIGAAIVSKTESILLFHWLTFT